MTVSTPASAALPCISSKSPGWGDGEQGRCRLRLRRPSGSPALALRGLLAMAEPQQKPPPVIDPDEARRGSRSLGALAIGLLIAAGAVLAVWAAVTWWGLWQTGVATT